MRLPTLLITGSLQLVLGDIPAGEMHADFPGFLRVRAEANLQIEVPHAEVKSTKQSFFTSALGGVGAEPITSTTDARRPFAVGADTFTDYASAAARTCHNQRNACDKIANARDGGNPFGITVSNCEEQEGAWRPLPLPLPSPTPLIPAQLFSFAISSSRLS
ncbi:hypothetical protein JHW43_004790 [Diplocarpon mali]|nr:hypothetical protein JHW43_004790 [Diplocarpon mali]